MESVPGAVATGSDWSATVPVAALSRRVIASEDACAPVAITAPGTDLFAQSHSYPRLARARHFPALASSRHSGKPRTLTALLSPTKTWQREPDQPQSISFVVPRFHKHQRSLPRALEHPADRPALLPHLWSLPVPQCDWQLRVRRNCQSHCGTG